MLRVNNRAAAARRAFPPPKTKRFRKKTRLLFPVIMACPHDKTKCVNVSMSDNRYYVKLFPPPPAVFRPSPPKTHTCFYFSLRDYSDSVPAGLIDEIQKRGGARGPRAGGVRYRSRRAGGTRGGRARRRKHHTEGKPFSHTTIGLIIFIRLVSFISRSLAHSIPLCFVSFSCFRVPRTTDARGARARPLRGRRSATGASRRGFPWELLDC